MKIHRFILAFLVLMLLPASSQADFYVIPGGGAPAGTQIRSLPYTISSPGFYYIKKDLTCAVSANGITISADDVTLDLMGFSLIGPGSGYDSGVYMYGRGNVEIRNGSFKGFYRGIFAEDSSNDTGHRVINVRSHGNLLTGILLNGRSNLVKDCTCFSNGGSGIYIGESSIVLNCTTYNNGHDGIWIDEGSSAMGNTSHGNTYHGIYAYNQSVSIVSNNCYSNVKNGIYANNYSLVKGNVCYSNTLKGINAGINCLIVQNVCNSNAGGNISSGSGSALVDNVAP